MQQYLEADPTIADRLVQSATSMKAGKRHGTKASVKKLKKWVADLEKVIQNSSSSETWWRAKNYDLNLVSIEGLAAPGIGAINKIVLIYYC